MWLTILRLMVLRFGSAWVLILLTLNFNRIAIVELQALAVLVTSLLALQFFLAPLQAVFGRLSDTYSFFGYRRSPCIVLAALINGLIFIALPSLAIELGQRSLSAVFLGLLLLGGFAVSSALYNANCLALIGDLLDQRQRDRFAPLIIMSGGIFGIIVALVSGSLMPTYTAEAMQALYNLTPLVMLGCLLFGLLGLERRAAANPTQTVDGLAISVPGVIQVLQQNPQARTFAGFLFVLNLGIFLQDAILEPFGGEIFAMSPQQTAQLQAPLGGGLLLGSLLIGLISVVRPLSKKGVMRVGAGLVILGLAMLIGVALLHLPALLPVLLLIFGFGVGLLQMGWFSLQVEMTIPGQVGLYLGLWTGSQMLGNGFANVFSGALHTLLIEGSVLPPAIAYATIFGIELVLMLCALLLLRYIEPQQFHAEDVSRLRLNAALVDS